MEFLKKSLPEDVVEYSIFVFPQKNKPGSALPANREKTFKEVKKFASQLIRKHLEDYIWQKETFKLEIKTSQSGVGYLYGCSNFGDSVEDEWLIIWLLRSISYSFPQVWIRVIDNTGEFLLAEAANVIPSWLYPDIAENRVWINNGELRIIPIDPSEQKNIASKIPQRPLSLDDVQEYVYNEKPTLYSHLIEDEAFRRTNNYPDQIHRNQHRALLLIPRKLAFVIHEKPAFVCQAVEAVYLRDRISMKSLVSSQETALRFPPNDLVTTCVKFNRVSYAQIKSQHLEYHPAWRTAGASYFNTGDRQNMETGMKVSCGFEMLLFNPQRQDENAVREISLILEELSNGQATLPSSDEIEAWGLDEDSETWMDIDFRDFEAELSGSGPRERPASATYGGFGDESKQKNLQEIVRRFEDFLKDDTLDGDDFDDGSETSDSESGKVVQPGPYSEDDFTKLMRDLLGMPEHVMQEIMTGEIPAEAAKLFAEKTGKTSGLKDNIDEMKSLKIESDLRMEEENEIQQLSAAMETELKEKGALHISTPLRTEVTKLLSRESQGIQKTSLPDGTKSKMRAQNEGFNLLANLLESFKHQGGEAGPGGNLMTLLNTKLATYKGTDDDKKVSNFPKNVK